MTVHGNEVHSTAFISARAGWYTRSGVEPPFGASAAGPPLWSPAQPGGLSGVILGADASEVLTHS